MQLAAAQGLVAVPVCPLCCKSQLRLSTVPDKLAHQPRGPPRRLRITALRSPPYDNPPSSSRYYDSSIPRKVTSSIKSVSFNQQLLVVLAVPLIALGIPFILDHPLFCIVLPVSVYYIPGLRAIAAPVFTALLQLILSGLRPSGSPRSEAFPWQQANTGAWSSPPIDVDYRALPGDSQEDMQSASNSSNSSVRQQQRQQAPRSKLEPAQPNAQPYRQRVNVQQATGPSSRSGQRQKITIRSADAAPTTNDRIVRQARPGQVGVNLDTSYTTEPRSTVVRALLVVFPFLKDWGGFL